MECSGSGIGEQVVESAWNSSFTTYLPTQSPVLGSTVPISTPLSKNSMNGIPPTSGPTTDSSEMNIGINPSIDAAKHTTIIIAEKIQTVIRFLVCILFLFIMCL